MTLIFWLQFAAVCVAGAMSPGPSLALVIRNSTKFSRIAGLMTAIGHGLGMGIYAVFAVTGLVIVITTNVYLFQLIQILGICFLLYFGIQFILQKSNEIIIDDNQKNINSFIQGFSISILNPKILIWFAAIFSQFVSVNGTFTSNSILVLTASIIDCIWYVIVALVVTSYGLNNFFQKRIDIIQKVSGFILVLIGIILIIDFF
ncbi:MAG: LysE family translocator [Alphaproteobacteria bacterium]|tara:strand:+ start:76 stop:684 length:609 start_codon:yes stop_codon:yes gene_type:complete